MGPSPQWHRRDFVGTSLISGLSWDMYFSIFMVCPGNVLTISLQCPSAPVLPDLKFLDYLSFSFFKKKKQKQKFILILLCFEEMFIFIDYYD